MKVYFIPGLGYDCQIFKHLDLGEVETECIEWIEPKKVESIRDYAQRLFAQVVEEEKVVLIGHSFGAVVAQEFAQLKKVDKIILLSSIQSSEELPFFLRVLSPLGLYKLFNKEFSIRTVKYWGRGHGFANAVDQELFKSMVGKHSNHYLQWALHALSSWQSPTLPIQTQLTQIHGTADKTLPIGSINKADILIEGGSHIMVYHQAPRISEILVGEIKNMES